MSPWDERERREAAGEMLSDEEIDNTPWLFLTRAECRRRNQGPRAWFNDDQIAAMESKRCRS